MRHIAICLATGLLIAACGTKAPLYLPPQTPPSKPVMTLVKEQIWPKAECKTDCGAPGKPEPAMVQSNNSKAPAEPAATSASPSTDSQPAAK